MCLVPYFKACLVWLPVITSNILAAFLPHFQEICTCILKALLIRMHQCTGHVILYIEAYLRIFSLNNKINFLLSLVTVG